MSVALIAGEGALPEEIARRMAKAGEGPVVYAMREDCGALVPHAKEVLPLFRAEIRATLGDMVARGVRKIMLAGVVPKTMIYRAGEMDGMARDFLAGLAVRDDHTLLGGIVSLFERAGFEVIGYRDLLDDLMATSGQIAGRAPTDRERDDMRYGMDIVSAIVPLSFGQTVVVCGKSVVAVEAMEGTDQTIRRAGSLCNGGAVVKRIKPGQDERFDIPTVGPTTLRLMAEAGLGCLALQAGWTLILNPDEFGTVAAEKNLAVVGVDY